MTLMERQARASRRVNDAVRMYGGALLCDAVGSGKTRTALAAAQSIARPTEACVVVVAPPGTHEGWRDEASAVGASPVLVSMGALSRPGAQRPVEGRPCVWIVDEAHHVRHAEIVRTRTLERWIGTDPVILVTATPVVNGPEDVDHLLGLFLERRYARSREAWLQVVVREQVGAVHGRATSRDEGPEPDDRTASALDAAAYAAALDVPDAAALFRSGLWRRWASSPEACESTLRRMYRFLRHLSEATAAGRTVARRDVLRAFDGPTQAVFPFVWPSAQDGPALDEIEAALTAVAHARELVATRRWADTHAPRVRPWIDEATPALLFTESRQTARAAAATLAAVGHRPIAVSGSGGWGPSFGRVDIETAFAVFGQGHPALRAPADVLVCTPVGAEGRNLQHASQVIHLDLPWNPARMEQRVGRADRLGRTGPLLERVLLPARAVRERVDPWAAIGRKSVWVERWQNGQWDAWDHVVPRETAWPATRAPMDELLRRARAWQRAGRDRLAAALLEVVLPVWAAGPGRARRAAWDERVRRGDPAELVEWARDCAQFGGPEPSGTTAAGGSNASSAHAGA